MQLPVLSLHSSDAVLAAQFREAAEQHGFLQIIDTDVSSKLIERAFSAARAFFALPLQVKQDLARDPHTNRGYELLGGQVLEGSLGKSEHHAGAHLVDRLKMGKKKGDAKEGLMMGWGGIQVGDEYFGRFGHGPNKLPTEDQVPGIRQIVDEYFTAVAGLSDRMMKIVALALDLDPAKSFTAQVTRKPIMAFRFLHYPPSNQQDVTGIGAHTDFGFITLLATDGTAGLQVYADGQWQAVESTPGGFILNIGDSLSYMTSGRFKSSLHRVMNVSGASRYSMPCFLEGNSDFVIRPLHADSGTSAETVEDVLRGRFDTTYTVS